MQKKITVSVGIPALNEESNIKNLLEKILEQKERSFRLEKIIVVSDGSTDRTEEEVLAVKSKKVTLITNKKRIGQALSQNKMIGENISDILVFINGDVLPQGNLFLEHLISPILKDSSVGLVGAKVLPIGSETFLGRVIDFSADLKHQLYRHKSSGNNIYNCHGRARAFSKPFLKKFKWKEIIAEDAYSYLRCIDAGFRFIYQPKAVVFYKSPQTIDDHMRQSIRFIQSKSIMAKFFDQQFVIEEYRFSKKEFFKTLIHYSIKNPHLLLTYSIIYILAKIRSIFGKKTKVTWDVSLSSKVVARVG